MEKYGIRNHFKIGDWIVGIGKYRGISEVFEHTLDSGEKVLQPFHNLNIYDHKKFRLATHEEKNKEIFNKLVRMWSTLEQD